MSGLPEFEGLPVRKASMRITNAGDGLSDALAVSPKAYHHGEEVFLVLKATITQINHKPERADDSDLVRIHTAKASEVVEVSESAVSSFLSEAAERTRKAKEAASGQTNLLDGASVTTIPLADPEPVTV